MPTKVFISWSGDRSKQLGEAVRHWLPGALQFVTPYFTPDDVEKGTRWVQDVTSELDECRVGIVCLTRENLDRPWLLFEAGALSKSFDKSKVMTLLFGVDSSDITGPLTLFQHTKFEKSEFKKLTRSINAEGGDAKLLDSTFDDVFEMWWPRLEEKVAQILDSESSTDALPHRTDRSILEELLELTRVSARPSPRGGASGRALADLIHSVHEFATDVETIASPEQYAQFISDFLPAARHVLRTSRMDVEMSPLVLQMLRSLEAAVATRVSNVSSEVDDLPF